MSQPADPDVEARTTLRLLGPDPANWVPDRPGIDHNVAIIGGGQTGSAFGFALRRAGIGRVTILEAAENEQRAGVWLNAARMNLLRTPKDKHSLKVRRKSAAWDTAYLEALIRQST